MPLYVSASGCVCRASVPFSCFFFFFQAEDGIRDHCVTGVQTCALPISPAEFLAQLFAPDEWVCITWADERGGLSRDEIRTCAEWQEIYEAKPGAFSDPRGVWFCINPLIGPEKRANECVSDFRRTLLEGDAPKQASAEEKQRIKEEMFTFSAVCGLPIEASYDSGGKSIHSIVRIDAKDANEFKERVEEIYAFARNLPGLDPGRKAAAQLSRLPGAYRGEQIQALLSYKSGADSYEDWHKAQLPEERCKQAVLGSICTAKDLRTLEVPPKAKLIGDW